MTESLAKPDNIIKEITEAIVDSKGVDINLMDIRKVDGSVCDYFIVCQGSSNVHVSSIASNVERKVSKSSKEKPFSVEGLSNSQWVILDYVNVVVHIFQEPYRAFYDIENLWGNRESESIST
ncbi:ribosome silencing factor [Ichthyobacterium seriolicida]|uniref:Ribosomal silencing factor RsfS n=1 Tax=Ichthyobacterium seriolicida TaxID=242600 RepID=A0A1J1DW50_9FLAO|nr:ribosome silencing factor [Ichthyobacterium seriolicida]BAV94089.1 iojap protein [Ichthyobacterium seriolicida]